MPFYLGCRLASPFLYIDIFLIPFLPCFLLLIHSLIHLKQICSCYDGNDFFFGKHKTMKNNCSQEKWKRRCPCGTQGHADISASLVTACHLPKGLSKSPVLQWDSLERPGGPWALAGWWAEGLGVMGLEPPSKGSPSGTCWQWGCTSPAEPPLPFKIRGQIIRHIV